MKAKITYKTDDHLKISWSGENGFGELNFHWDSNGRWELDSEMLGMDRVIEIIKALPDEVA